ncbi:MAG: type II secretion system protein GspN [Desulfobacteraceae bacterium]|nr:type II secretion system protein GspN [Desulfobacteraceae bacterium]
MNNQKTYVAYVAFFIAAMVFFIYYLFPSTTIADYMSNAASLQHPDLEVFVDHVSPAFPPGLKFDGLKIDYRQQPALTAQRARFSPVLRTLFSTSRKVNFDIVCADGSINGQADIIKEKDGVLIKSKAELSDIEIGKINAVNVYSPHLLSGILNGQVSVNTDLTSDVQNEAELTISDFKITLETPIINVESFEFKSIVASLSLSQRRIRLRKCTLKGRDMDGEITGTLSIRVPFENSLLNFSGTIQPHPEFMAQLSSTLPVAMLSAQSIGQKGLPFRIRGTVNNPGFSLR